MPEHLQITIPVKDGFDRTSENVRALRSTLLALAGGANYLNLTTEQREILGWIFLAEY